MVAEHADDIHTVQCRRGEGGRDRIELIEAARIVDHVAHVDAEIIAGTAAGKRVKDAHKICRIGGLGIAQDEEIGAGLVFFRQGKLADI